MPVQTKSNQRGSNLSPSSRDVAYDKPVEDDGRVSMISNSTLEEERMNGRGSIETFDGHWYDPETYDADGNDSISAAIQNTSEKQPLLQNTHEKRTLNLM